MTTTPQRLRDIAQAMVAPYPEYGTPPSPHDIARLIKAIATELEAPAADVVPVAWVRWRSDGGYEGPLMNAQMDDVRKQSGAWTPLYGQANSAVDAPTLVVLAGGHEVLSCSGPELDAWQSLAGIARAQYMTTAQQQASHRHELTLLGGAHTTSDTALPVVAWEWVDEREGLKVSANEPADYEMPHQLQPLVHLSAALSDTAALRADLADRDARTEDMRVEWAEEVAALNARITSLSALSVENIMLDVVPGDDGGGHEVYAKTVRDVEDLLSSQSDFIEKLQFDVSYHTARARHAEDSTEVAKARISELENGWKDRACTDIEVLLAEYHSKVWEAATAYEEGRTPVDYDLAGVEVAKQIAAAVTARDMRIAELDAKLNTPQLHDFAAAVVLEAAHQRERWGADNDVGKKDSDWFWLLGHLAGKALNAAVTGNTDKALHHTISTAAACANWHAALTGEHTAMRPGIDPVARGIEPAVSKEKL